jgi:hypothetical protein
LLIDILQFGEYTGAGQMASPAIEPKLKACARARKYANKKKHQPKTASVTSALKERARASVPASEEAS